MKKILLGLLLGSFNLLAQTTPNPKIDWKSSQTVFINKAEINDSYTIFHMQYYDKSSESNVQKYLQDNPDIARRLERLGITPQQAEKFFRNGISTEQTISWQPGAKIVLPDGRKFGFIKAVNIPVSPERQTVEPGEKYFFKVYFEKIPAGFEKIDLTESSVDSDGDYQYWNFKGIHIVNPKSRVYASDTPLEKPKVQATDFKVYGRILNSVTELPINAKVICLPKDQSGITDSLQTSRSGKYEFVINESEIVFEVSAPGYKPVTESVNLSIFLKNGSFEKDIYIDPLEINSTTDEKTKEEVIVTPPVIESSTKIGEQLDSTATSFKLDKVYFNMGQAIILETSYEQLNHLALYLIEHPELKIQIDGHTDNQGDAKLNDKLSLDRAYNVRQYLIDKGIDGKRIKFKGYGSRNPVSLNDTEEHRSKNRRVEYHFID